MFLGGRVVAREIVPIARIRTKQNRVFGIELRLLMPPFSQQQGSVTGTDGLPGIFRSLPVIARNPAAAFAADPGTIGLDAVQPPIRPIIPEQNKGRRVLLDRLACRRQFGNTLRLFLFIFWRVSPAHGIRTHPSDTHLKQFKTPPH